MKTHSICGAIVCLGCLVAVPAAPAWGQAEAAAKPKAPAQADSALAGGSSAAGADDDEAAKNAIFNSDDWLYSRMAFDDWLSVQRIYDDNQVAQIKYRMQKKIAAMNSRDLRLFMLQMQAKLAILLSPEAGELRRWMGHFVSPTVVLTPEELARFDIVTMTAPQLEEALRTVQSRKASRQSAGSAFQAARQQQVSQTQATNRQRQQSNQQFRANAKSARTNRMAQPTPLAPRALEPRTPRPRPQIVVGGAGGAAIMLSSP